MVVVPVTGLSRRLKARLQIAGHVPPSEPGVSLHGFEEGLRPGEGPGIKRPLSVATNCSGRSAGSSAGNEELGDKVTATLAHEDSHAGLVKEAIQDVRPMHRMVHPELHSSADQTGRGSHAIA